MELPHVGKHCALDSCRSLDFLPVTCPFCKETFCADHRLSHPCANRPDKAVARCTHCDQMVVGATDDGLSLEQSLERHIQSGCKDYLRVAQAIQMDKPTCSVNGCHELDEKNAIVQHCAECDHVFCLKHRHGIDHGCPALEIDVKARRKKEAEELVNKIKLGQQQKVQKKPVISTKKKLNPTIELMKMKSKAKGQASIPMTSRIYLYVEYPLERGRSADLPMFFDKTIRIGKLLDIVAAQCGVKNDNNRLQPEDTQRLVLLKDACILDNSSTLESVLVNTDRIILERLENLE